MTVQKFIKIHFALVLFVLVNFATIQLFGIGVNQNLIFIAKIILYLLAVLLFFMTFKKWRGLSIYFSIFLFYPLLTIILWAFDGILGSIFVAIFLVFFGLPDETFKADDYTFRENFSGFLSPCCGSYEILQKKYLIFQKKVGQVSFSEDHSFDSASFVVHGKVGYLKLNMDVYDSLSKKQMVDTTLAIYIP